MSSERDFEKERSRIEINRGTKVRALTCRIREDLFERVTTYRLREGLVTWAVVEKALTEYMDKVDPTERNDG